MYNYFLHAHTYFIIKRKQWTERLTRKNSFNYTPFVILCAPRSGSTLLHTYLNFHTHIVSHGEVLREHAEVNHVDSNQLRSVLSSTVLKPYSSQVSAVGLKLFYEYNDDQSLYKDCFCEIISRKDIKIIHLIRKDILKLYVSLKIAEKTNVWSSGKSSTRDNVSQITIDTTDYLQFQKEYLQHQQLFKNLFQDHAMIEISYEELIGQSDEVLQSVQQFLGVEPKQLKTLLKKQNQNDIKMHITNYDEVQKLCML